MKQLDLILHNPTGLHARPAKKLVTSAKQFESDISIEHGPKKANAKSLISVLTLGVKSGGKIRITAEGTDEENAIGELERLVQNGLGDEESAPQSPPSDSPKKIESASGHLLRGLPGAPGLAIASIYQWRQVEIKTSDSSPTDQVAEVERLREACDEAGSQLADLCRQVRERLGAAEAAVFEVQLEFLEDSEILGEVYGNIKSGLNASAAWQTALEKKASVLDELEDDLLAARAADLRDLGCRVLRVLVGNGGQREMPAGPVILIAEDLSPSETAEIDPAVVLGLCTVAGSPNSHTAILARSLGIPAVVAAGPEVLQLENGRQVILDGDDGALNVVPKPEELDAARNEQQKRAARHSAQLQAASEPATTRDGTHVEVAANILAKGDAARSLIAGADSVGVLRTEFLFLDRSEPPTEEEQFEAYKSIVLKLEGKSVIIRTLDIGADKPAPYLPQSREMNPALGRRGIRLGLACRPLLQTQLRAILRAAAFGPVGIMFPMVATLEEWRQARELLQETQAEIEAPEVETGIMIEIPSAALMAKAFAREVDFFSIGTNDLAQYTLAMDRTLPELAAQIDGLHPSVLRLIDMTIAAAHEEGKHVGVCGELAADPVAIPILVGLGVDELSVSVPSIPAVKARVRSLEITRSRELAKKALGCLTATEVRNLPGFVDSK